MNSNKIFQCPIVNCNNKFTRQYNLNRHIERKHLSDNFVEKCLLCGQIFENCEEIQIHYKTFHKPSEKFYLKDNAFQKSVQTYRYNYDDNIQNFVYGQKKILPSIQQLLQIEAGKKTLIKVGLIYICEMSMEDHIGEKVSTTLIPFRAPNFLTNANSLRSLKQNIIRSYKIQENELERFTNSGSNWTFDRCVAFDIEIAAMRPMLMGGDDRININNIKNHRFLFNPNNKDQKCFLHCIYFNLKETFNSFTDFEKSLNLTGIKFPITIPQVKTFLKKNKKLDISINILYRDISGKIFPYEYGLGDGKHKINLLLLRRSSDLNAINHFVCIKNVDKFLRQVYNKNCKKSYKKIYTCLNCLNTFTTNNIYSEHVRYCFLNKPRKEILSDKKTIKFTNFKNQHPVDYIAFLDFECILPDEKIICSECMHLRCKCDRSYTLKLNDQLPIAYSFIVLNQNNKIIHEKTYSGENAANHLIDHLLNEEKSWISNLFSQFKELNLSQKENINFNCCSECYLCHKSFTTTIKCRDHCHFTGKYLGAACQTCNLDRRKQQQLKIFMHNGSKYDFHFIIKALNDRRTDIKNIHILPYNGENFRTIQFNSFIFLDSMSFLQNSLAQLSDDLSKTDNPYSILRQTYLVRKDGKFSKKKFRLVLGKSFFPYEFW